MIITGIHNLRQIQNAPRFTDFFGREKKISITLYDKIVDIPDADELAERILLGFSDDGGVFKWTYARRFEEFDQAVLGLLKKIFAENKAIEIHDVGVSDGRTACDFFGKLSVEFPGLIYHASDYNPEVFIIEKGSLRITLSRHNRVLEIVWPPFVFNALKRDSYLYPVNHLVKFFIGFAVVKPCIKDYLLGKFKARPLLLFSPRALNLARNDCRFRLEEYDILAPLGNAGNTHVIRAMNVLNPSYFSTLDLRKAVKNLHSNLMNNGLLVIGSNLGAGTVVHGGVYRKTEKGFEKIWQSGDGSPIDEIIMSLFVSCG